MKIIIQDQIIEVENDETKIESYLDRIEVILRERNIKLSYLIIDERPIYKNFPDYLNTHIHEINTIIVIADEDASLVYEVLVSTENYLKKVMLQLDNLSDEFYKQPDNETWIKLGDLFEGIQWLIETVVKIDGTQKVNSTTYNYEIWNEYVQLVADLSSIIKEMELALLNRDNILMGDLLHYEVTPLFQKIYEKLIFLVQGDDNCVS